MISEYPIYGNYLLKTIDPSSSLSETNLTFKDVYIRAFRADQNWSQGRYQKSKKLSKVSSIDYIYQVSL